MEARACLVIGEIDFGLLHAPRLQLTIEEAVDIAGTLVVEAGGVALQTLVGARSMSPKA